MPVSAEVLLSVSVADIAVIIIVVAVLNYLSWRTGKKKKNNMQHRDMI
jgi:hypothetical protein